MIGAAFSAVITAFVADLITPLIAAIGGKPDFGALTFTINGSEFKYGDFLNALIAFLMRLLWTFGRNCRLVRGALRSHRPVCW